MRAFLAFIAALVLIALSVRQRHISSAAEANGLYDFVTAATIATIITLMYAWPA